MINFGAIYEKSIDKEEADQILLNATGDMRTSHCPVVNSQCLGSKCISYCEGSVTEIENREGIPRHKIIFPDCRNPLVTGYITVIEVG